MRNLPLKQRTVALLVVLIPLMVLFVYVALRSGPFALVPVTVATVENRSITPSLFGSGSAIWSLAGQLTQPIFNPGLPAEKRAALAAFDAAAANYKAIVLESLRNVADVLRALENNAHRLTALSVVDGAARSALESIQRQYALGAASYVQLLTA